jgi:hypothetical protein
MAVPGRAAPDGAPADLAASELFAVDAYLREFDAEVVALDREAGRVALRRTAFYPGGGGQPHDLGVLRWSDGEAAVTRVSRDAGRIWHWLDPTTGSGSGDLPDEHTAVEGRLDWDRRHLTMRTHTALHILCGVIWAGHRVAVTEDEVVHRGDDALGGLVSGHLLSRGTTCSSHRRMPATVRGRSRARSGNAAVEGSGADRIEVRGRTSWPPSPDRAPVAT